MGRHDNLDTESKQPVIRGGQTLPLMVTHYWGANENKRHTGFAEQ